MPFRKNVEIKTFAPFNINLHDFNRCEDKQKESEDNLVELYHMLEDIDLNAVETMKVAKLIKKWRKVRRYWKALSNVKKKMKIDVPFFLRAMDIEVRTIHNSRERTKKSLTKMRNME